MDVYICDKCGKSFKRKNNLDYHVFKNVCKNKKYMCQYCGNTFNTKVSMHRHVRETCKKRIEEDKRRDEIYERLLKLEESNNELKNQNAKIMKDNEHLKNKMTNGSTKNNIESVNINNGIQYNINLSGYGKEDMSKIDKTDIIKAFKSGFNSTLKLTEAMHFNPKYPEFHNVYISSMKNQYAMMYDGTEWSLVMKEDLIDKLYDNKRDFIEENLDEFVSSLSKSQVSALYRWLNADEEHPYIKKIKNGIKLMLYNKRFMVINNKCLIESNAQNAKKEIAETTIEEIDDSTVENSTVDNSTVDNSTVDDLTNKKQLRKSKSNKKVIKEIKHVKSSNDENLDENLDENVINNSPDEISDNISNDESYKNLETDILKDLEEELSNESNKKSNKKSNKVFDASDEDSRDDRTEAIIRQKKLISSTLAGRPGTKRKSIRAFKSTNREPK